MAEPISPLVTSIPSANTPELQSDPLFLNNNDNPNAMLVSHTLNGENFSSWRRSMEMTLSAKNKLAFVNGSLPQPEPSSPTYSTWIRCNDMVSSWLINSVSKDMAESVLYIDTAAGIWKDLIDRFSQGNGPRIFQVQKSIVSLSQGQLTVTAYFTKLKSLWEELSNYSIIIFVHVEHISILRLNVIKNLSCNFLWG